MKHYSYIVKVGGKSKCTAFDDSETLEQSIAGMIDRYTGVKTEDGMIKRYESITIEIRYATDEEIEENA